ncbi:MAG: ABC transporter permease [Defluviitaleaceae bacterium]|nr:ABC transporter permease [Defluviitaleaceae bacterium]
MSKKTQNHTKEHARFLKGEKRKSALVIILQISILIAFFALWEAASHFGWIEAFIFSSPSRMWRMFTQMLSNGELLHHVWATTSQVLISFVAGTLLGFVIATWLWSREFARRVLSSYLVIFNALPKTALAPIIIVWVGNNPRAIVVTALLISVVVAVLNILTGFLQVEEEKIKLIKSFGGSKAQTFTKVVFPAAIPDMINALKINIGLSFVGVIVGEFLVAQAGLGFLIVYGSQIFRLDMVMMSIVILCLLAALFYQAITAIEKAFKNWAK